RVEKALVPKAVFEPADGAVDERQRLARQRSADAVRMGGAVGIVQPEDRDVRPEVVDPELEVRLDGALVLRIVRRFVRGRWAEHRKHLRRELGRFRVVGVQDRATRYGVVQEVRGSRAAGADTEKLAAVLPQDLAERGGGEQLSFRTLDGFQVFALAGVATAC